MLRVPALEGLKIVLYLTLGWGRYRLQHKVIIKLVSLHFAFLAVISEIIVNTYFTLVATGHVLRQ